MLNGHLEDRLVNLKGFGVKQENCGLGTQALYFICEVADREDIDLVVKPSFGVNNERLRRFYGRFGFQASAPVEMIRRAKTQRNLTLSHEINGPKKWDGGIVRFVQQWMLSRLARRFFVF